jgi:hypothetical protein
MIVFSLSKVIAEKGSYWSLTEGISTTVNGKNGPEQGVWWVTRMRSDSVIKY